MRGQLVRWNLILEGGPGERRLVVFPMTVPWAYQTRQLEPGSDLVDVPDPPDGDPREPALLVRRAPGGRLLLRLTNGRPWTSPKRRDDPGLFDWAIAALNAVSPAYSRAPETPEPAERAAWTAIGRSEGRLLPPLRWVEDGPVLVSPGGALLPEVGWSRSELPSWVAEEFGVTETEVVEWIRHIQRMRALAL